jgi:cephalosporin hydroxylase
MSNPFSFLSPLILLASVTTSEKLSLKVPVHNNVYLHTAAAGSQLPSPAQLQSTVCNTMQAQHNIDPSTCVQSLTASIIKGRTAVQENLSPAGIRLGLGSVANCLYHDLSSLNRSSYGTTIEPCDAFYTDEAEWKYTTLSGQTITKDDVFFLMDRLYEFGQLGTSKLCENCGGLFTQTKFRGIPIQSTPNDLFVLQEIIHEHSPDVIVETGTASGGSAIFYATHLGPTGLVVTIDIDGVTNGCAPAVATTGLCKKAEDHHMWASKIRSLTGRSDDPLIHQQVGELLQAWAALHGREPRVMLSLDGPHLCGPVYAELMGLGGYVTQNQYIVVQDTKMDHQYLHYVELEYYVRVVLSCYKGFVWV